MLELESKNRININELTEKPEFSALLLRTIQIAAVTSQKEQLENLQNYIINLSKTPDITEDELYIILEIIGSFTPSHVKALRFYRNPKDYIDQLVKYMRDIKSQGIDPGTELAYVFGTGNPDYWQNIFHMLSSRNFVIEHTTMIDSNSPDIVVRGEVTDLGRQVLSMIESNVN